MRRVTQVSPGGRYQGARAVRKHEQEIKGSSTPRPSEDRELLSFEWMMIAEDGYGFGIAVEVVVGSVSCVPSTTLTIPGS